MTDDIALRARRRTRAIGVVASTVLLAITAGVTGLVVALNGQTGATATGQGGPGTAGPGALHVTTEPADPAPLSTAPSSTVAWTTVAGAGVPVSATAGPADSAGGRARGFARTPFGAVLAAAHISVRLSPQAGPAVFEPTLRDQVVGPDAAALADRVEDDYQQARAQLGLPHGEPAGRLYSTIRGYQVDVESIDRPTVRLLIEGPGASGGSVLVSLVSELQWVDGDWALVAPADGDWSTETSVVTDGAGFKRFADGG
ncbi:hypothetical protein SAMN05421812_12540 [Asanoa hainanensis]|uniref:DUF8175 domain-containing protein n=1 Tax=Asanoa hainanensis TaxID=560556 RepID=A0A239PF32_9ACTN|nr:hypothetical protein [Asanoa hainanensis]SNT65697.1 hypothetical protein SAMN05421812_12540 [Asanoa hainanensis]